MPTLSRADSRTRRVCRDAAFLCAALMFSYLETMFPLSLLIPLPGVKLGLANVLITAVFFWYSPLDAGVVSLLRVSVAALLFGSVTSFFFSAMGALFAYLVLWACRLVFGRFCSYIGISVLAAAAHQAGQITAAVMLFFSAAPMAYLPVLLCVAAVTGGVTGFILNLLAPRLENRMKRGQNA